MALPTSSRTSCMLSTPQGVAIHSAHPSGPPLLALATPQQMKVSLQLLPTALSMSVRLAAGCCTLSVPQGVAIHPAHPSGPPPLDFLLPYQHLPHLRSPMVLSMSTGISCTLSVPQGVAIHPAHPSGPPPWELGLRLRSPMVLSIPTRISYMLSVPQDVAIHPAHLSGLPLALVAPQELGVPLQPSPTALSMSAPLM